MLDLLVIGAGLSGLTAAITSAQAGLSVRVVTKGLSALFWGAGTLDLLGYLPDSVPVDAPFAALEQLPSSHPLRQVGAAAVRQSVSNLQNWLAEQALVYTHAENESNLWLPSAVGAKRPAYLAPAAQAAARLDDPSPLLVVGFDHLRDFYPALLADNLTRQGHAARPVSLPLSLLIERSDPNSVLLAQALENPACVQRLAAALRPHLLPGERVALPAILGLEQHSRVVAELSGALGAPVAEISTLPPSVPGMRLHRALVHKLEQLGGRVESNMAATEFGVENGRITWVATATSARPLRHRATTYLLATGGILGGGFNSDHNGRVWETLFNLPLSNPVDRGQWFRPEFLDPAGHPIFQGGALVNSAWQPVDASGNVVYENLWAAGNLLAHADAIRTRSHEAVALATGAAAAHALLAQRQPAHSAT